MLPLASSTPIPFQRFLFIVLFCSVFGLAQPMFAEATSSTERSDKTENSWDVLKPPFKLNSTNIQSKEVTWSSLGVAPNGEQFVFDALGDIFISSIRGGDAAPLTQDLAWNIQPTFSPDGTRIAFISDRDGLSNIWTMNVDGTELKQISKEAKHMVHSPQWSPDGRYIVASKGIMSRRSIPAGEIWLYHVDGGDGFKIKERPRGNTEQKNITDPIFSHDGKYLYFTKDVTAGGTFSYNRDPLKSIFAISRFELETGEETTFISGTGGAVGPSPSPDGAQIAFVRRVKNKTALFTKNLSNGLETVLTMELERDMQEGFGTEGYVPYFDWTPDSESIVYWAKGTFHSINVASKKVTDIPLTLNTTVQYADALRFKVDVAPEQFKVQMARWAQKSPNGRSIVFQALGKIYIKDIKSGETRRLTRQNKHDEYYPQFSLDGSKIAYSTWNDQSFGDLRIVSARGGKGRVVSNEPGHYKEVAFSPDGQYLAYRRSTGGYLLSPAWSLNPGIYVANLKNDKHTKVSSNGWLPHFSAEQERVYFTDSVTGSDYPETQLVSVNLQGEDRREHVYGSDKVSEYRLSHNGKWLAFIYQHKAYVAPFTHTGKRIDIGPKNTAVSVVKLADNAGEHIRWSVDDSTVGWHLGAHYFEQKVQQVMLANQSNSGGADESSSEQDAELKANQFDLSFDHISDKPSGYKALVGGTVVTMRNANTEREIIENGVVLINENRIVAVGSEQQVSVPDDAMILDARGKTIVPGLIDAHAHGSQGSEEIIPQQNWSQYSNVAFGVTTIHDPSNDTTEVFSAAELQRAGKIVAPRIYSTGTILYGAEDYGYKAVINNLDDARFHLQRMKDVGAISVKSYNQQRRDRRQQVLKAASDIQMMVVPEGGGKYQQNISMLVDGHTGLEHALPIAYGYDDLTQLWSKSSFGYTPTFVVSYGGLMGEEYWYDRTEVWKNPRLMRYTPHFLVDGRSIRRPTAPDNQYNHIDVARYAKTLRDRGVGVHIGAHGQREGLAAHWEMWIMQQGGFTPWEALRGGTIDGARHLGMDMDIGSIEVGKLADLVVIEGDVLNDIRRSEFVSHTVLNGRIFETNTMNEMGSSQQRGPFFFETSNDAFMPAETARAIQRKAEKHHWVH